MEAEAQFKGIQEKIGGTELEIATVDNFQEILYWRQADNKVVAGEGMCGQERGFCCFQMKELTKCVYAVRNYIVKRK